MKTITKTLKTLCIACFMIASTTLIAQTTHIVDNNPGTDPDFTDVQTAIDAATSGDIIYVQQSSTSYGNIQLNKELTLIGRSHSDASYSSTLDNVELLEGCSNSTLKGFKIQTITDPFDSSGTLPLIENLVIENNRIATLQNLGVYRTFNNVLIQGNTIDSSISIGSNTSNILIANNIINSSNLSFSMVDTVLFANNILAYYAGVSISNNTPDLLNISNCIFVADYQFLTPMISLTSSTGSFQIQNSVTYSYNATQTTYNFATGTNITLSNVQENVDPLFNLRSGSSGTLADPNGQQFNPNLDDLTLQAGSPVTDDGLYEGYNFKPLGTPTGYPSIKIDSYSATVPKNSNLTVTIKAKTN